MYYYKDKMCPWSQYNIEEMLLGVLGSGFDVENDLWIYD